MDGTLIEAWASHKSFKRKDHDSGAPPGRNPEVEFKGQERCNDTHESTTDAHAGLFKKSQRDKSRLCHMRHILMENRNGLIVDGEITHASGTAEREAALAMLKRRGNRGCASCMSHGKCAPETDAMDRNQAEMTVAIAAMSHLGDPLLRNSCPLCVQ